jgi:hypothetical protein
VDRARWLGNILNPLTVRVRFWHPDRFLERTLPLVNWLVGSCVVRPALAGAQRERRGSHSCYR